MLGSAGGCWMFSEDSVLLRSVALNIHVSSHYQLGCSAMATECKELLCQMYPFAAAVEWKWHGSTFTDEMLLNMLVTGQATVIAAPSA
jgi:hypothetical protein